MRGFLIIIWLLSWNWGQSQQSVDFGANAVCEGANTVFVSFSSPEDSIIRWDWDMDNDGLFDDKSGPTVSNVFDSAGTYNVSLEVEFNDGAILSTTKIITINPTPEPNILTESGCVNTTTTLSAEILNNIEIDTYRWEIDADNSFDDASGNDTIWTYDSVGVFSLKVKVRTNAGCEAIATNQIEINPLPETSFTVDDNCYGDSSLLSSTSIISSGSIVSYLWDINLDGEFNEASGQEVSFQYSNTGFKSAILWCTSDKGCEDYDTTHFTIFPKPDANFTIKDGCIGENVNIQNLTNYDIGSVSYLWNFGDGNTATSHEPLKAYNSSGIFDVALLVTSDQGCTDTASNVVEIFGNPTAVSSIADACKNLPLSISNESFTNEGFIVAYKWDFGNGIIDFSQFPDYGYDADGTYTVEFVVTNNFNCTDTSLMDVEVYAGPSISIYNHDNFTFCADDSVWLEIYPPENATIIWSSGGTNSNEYVTSGGFHYVTVFDSMGCMDKDSIELTALDVPAIEAGPDLTIQLGETVSLNGQGDGNPIWSGEEVINDFLWQTSAVPNESGYYILSTTGSNGCTDKDSLFVTVEKNYVLDPTSLLSPNGDGKNDTWIVRNILMYPECEIMIYNRWNQLIYNTTNYMNDWDGTYNQSPLPEGAYYYTITCPGTDINYAGSINLIR